MKYIIGLFGELDLELQLGQGRDRIWRLTGAFPTFPNRRGKPHVSLFFEPNAVPHFTAFRNHPRQFRRWLTSATNETLGRLLVKATDDAAGRLMSELRPVTLDRLESDGWLVHAANPAALSRWMTTFLPIRRRVDIGEDQVLALFSHVLRTWARPNAIPPLKEPGKALAIRLVGDDLEVSPLFHFNRGIVAGESIQSAGWYWNPNQDRIPIPIQLPPELNVSAIRERLLACLERYPKRGGIANYEVPLGSWANAAGFVLGFYASDILEAVLRIAIARQIREMAS